MNQSAVATQEYKHIVKVRTPRTRVRMKIAELFRQRSSRFMSGDILACDDNDFDKIKTYAEIAFYFFPTQELINLFKEANITDYAECDDCHKKCTPDYISGTKGKEVPLCKSCANDAYGH